MLQALQFRVSGAVHRYDPESDQIGIFLYQIVTSGDSTPSRAEKDAFKQMLERIVEH